MKFKVNEKILFDDEGNVSFFESNFQKKITRRLFVHLIKRIATNINMPRSINITDQLAQEINSASRDTKERSGIDIEEAKRMLQNEDQYDKQLYRERIKRVHRVRFNQ